MRSISLFVFIASVLLAAVFIWSTADQLPAIIATHFDAGNKPNGWMSHMGYRQYILGFLVGLPTLSMFLAGGLPKLMPLRVNVPNREYWLSPERREASLNFLFAHGCRLGCLMAFEIAGVHYMTLEAHRSIPPQLSMQVFLPMVAIFFLGIIAWIGTLYWRFRKIPEST